MLRSGIAQTKAAEFLLYVDRDDPRKGEYRPFADLERTKVMFGNPIGRGAAVNHLIDQSRDYRMFLVVSDDITYERDGWEGEISAAMDSFGDEIGLVHLASENHQPWVNWACVSRRWIDTLGWFNYPALRNFCQDTVIQALAEALERIVRIEPKVVHHHVINHPDVGQRLVADQSIFLWYFAQHFGSDLRKLRGALTR